MKLWFISLVFLLSFPLWAQEDVSVEQLQEMAAQLGRLDLAVDDQHNTVFVSSIKMEPCGKIHVVDIQSQEEISSLCTTSLVVRGKTQQEIELGRDGQLYHLTVGEGRPELAAIVAQDGDWSKSLSIDYSDLLLGKLFPRNLKAEADGRISVEAIEFKSKMPVLVLINPLDRSVETLPLFKVKEALESLDEAKKEQSDNDSEESSDYAKGSGLGFSAGFLAGLGFAYRQMFASGWGFHIAAGGYADESSVDANVGIELLRVLDETNKVRFYALAGSSLYYSSSKYLVYDYATTPCEDKECYTGVMESGRYESSRSSTYNFGIGLGIEYAPAGLRAKGLSMTFELPIFVRFVNRSDRSGFGGIAPWPSVTLIYYFRR